jgi:hypothetical protein
VHVISVLEQVQGRLQHAYMRLIRISPISPENNIMREWNVPRCP